MKSRLRRGVIVFAAALSIVGGALSIRLAADLAAAAAPPPAPPVSIEQLQARLLEEQNRATALQQQLDELTGVTGELHTAIDSTETLVSTDATTADDLRKRLKAAESRLALLTRLLREASARLAALGQSGPTVPPTKPPSGGGGGSGGGGVQPTPKPTPKPTAPPAATFTLTVTLSGGNPVADWSSCSASDLSGYALVRSLDSEIHYPPEDFDTVVAQVGPSGTTAATDSAAPAGRVWYRVYCLGSSGGETRVRATTSTVSITVP